MTACACAAHAVWRSSITSGASIRDTSDVRNSGARPNGRAHMAVASSIRHARPSVLRTGTNSRLPRNILDVRRVRYKPKARAAGHTRPQRGDPHIHPLRHPLQLAARRIEKLPPEAGLQIIWSSSLSSSFKSRDLQCGYAFHKATRSPFFTD